MNGFNSRFRIVDKESGSSVKHRYLSIGGNIMKKKLVAVLLAGSMVFGLAACGSSDDGSSDSGSDDAAATTETSSEGSTLKAQLGPEPDYLDPALNSSVDGGCLAVNSFVGLYTYNQDQELTPALGEAEVSEDGTVYTFKMIESKWSNGDELTANDFVYSWKRAADPNTGADYSYLYDIIARDDAGELMVEATDDYTLTVTLTNPCPYFLDLTAFPAFFPVPQASVEEADPDGTNPGAWAQEAGFVSNGAYTLESWAHNESMVYVKNENYYDADNVTLDRLELMLSADDTAIYAAYNSGDLDFVDTVPNDEIQSVMDNDDFYIVENLGTYYVGFNVNSDIFDGKTPEQAAKMREAMSLLIDRNYIAENIGQTGQVPADSFISPGMADGNGGEFKGEDDSYYDAETTGAGNVEEAVKLLEEAGYTMTDNGDGTYGISPALGFEYLTNDGTGHEQIAQAIQQDLAVVGIEVTIATEDWNVFLEDRKAGNFGVAREGWLADYNDPINMLELFRSDSGNNDMQLGVEPVSAAAPQNWSEYDALIDEIRTMSDMEARVEKMHEAEDMLMDTWAVVPLYYYNDIYMQKENVTGVYATVYGMKYFMYATVE
jgi:peptide/nickel transport system substrate-binding protein/oligopeptide transport system substrate-binding protein